MTRTKASLASLSFFSILFVLPACSSSSSNSPPPSGDAGASDGGDSGAVTVHNKGRAIDFDTGNPLPGVTVTEQGTTVSTDAAGVWTSTVAPNVPSRPSLSANGYITAHLPEIIYTADYDSGDVTLPSLNTFKLGQDAQRGYDATMASISVVVRTFPSCPSDDGATLKVISPSTAKVMYFKGGFPSNTATAVIAGQKPAISIYNVPVGQDVQLELDHPTCTMVPFPVTDGTFTFTGKTDLEAGKANSVLILYLK